MTRRLTDAQVRRMHRLEDAIYRAQMAIFGASPDPRATFAKCREIASPALLKGWQDALAARDEFEARMIREGRAYRSSGGLLMSY